MQVFFVADNNFMTCCDHLVLYLVIICNTATSAGVKIQRYVELKVRKYVSKKTIEIRDLDITNQNIFSRKQMKLLIIQKQGMRVTITRFTETLIFFFFFTVRYLFSLKYNTGVC